MKSRYDNHDDGETQKIGFAEASSEHVSVWHARNGWTFATAVTFFLSSIRHR